MVVYLRESIKVAIYLRKSRADEPIEALAKHKAVLTRLADENGWEYEIFEEIGSSIKLDWRVEFDKMLSRIDEFKYVLVMDTDRIGRSFIVFEEIKKPFKYHGVIIKTPNQEIDLRIDGHEMLLDFQTVISKGEYQQTVKRLKMGKAEGARKGHWVNGIAPLGYTYDHKKKKLVLNEQEYPLVKEIFSMALKNMSYGEIAINLNLRGFKTKKDNDFTAASIKAILNNRAYVGEVVFRQVSQLKEVEDEIISTPNSHPALISEADWLEIQSLATRRRTNSGKVVSVVRSAFQGLLYCGCCGKKLSIEKSTKPNSKSFVKNCRTVDAYGEHCPNRSIQLSYVEEAVFAALREYREEAVSKARELLITDNGHLKDEIAAIIKLKQAELDKQLAILDTLLDNMLIGVVSQEDYSRKKAEKGHIVEALKVDIRQLEIKLDSLDVSKQVSRYKQIIKFIDNLEAIEAQELNRILLAEIDRIVITALPDTNSTYRRAKLEPAIVIEFA